MSSEEKVWEEAIKQLGHQVCQPDTVRDCRLRKKYPPSPGTCATVSRTVAPTNKVTNECSLTEFYVFIEDKGGGNLKQYTQQGDNLFQ